MLPRRVLTPVPGSGWLNHLADQVRTSHQFAGCGRAIVIQYRPLEIEVTDSGKGKRHISERPKAVAKRREVGHWEADTVMGADLRHCLLTMVERATGYTVIKKLSARHK